MLTRLSVRDFAIVDRIEVELGPGMTVLTGETGAGKSILIDALGLVLGERGSNKVVRPGAKRAEFSAEFDLEGLDAAQSWLADNELDQDGECLMRRTIGVDGRSRAFINGTAVNVQQLKSLGDYLVDIHGQHFHQSLTRRAIQRELLDHYGGHANDVAECARLYRTYRELADEHANAGTREADRASRMDMLRFQIDELDALHPDADEIDALSGEQQRLKHSGQLAAGAQHALSAVSDADGGNAVSLLADARKALAAVSELDTALGDIVGFMDAADIQLAEASAELARYLDGLEADPGRQDWVEERLAALKSVARKHQTEPSRLSEVLARLSDELRDLENAAQHSEELEALRDRAWDDYSQAAGLLSAKRKDAASRLSSAVTDAMQGLGMPSGRFEIALTTLTRDAAGPSGLDGIEFLITANPGQAAAPLSKVASGGELSRMSLAIQVIASDGSRIPTMIFDEVDSGVGGGVAEMVGRRLRDLGNSRQVLCVTHLPQVASLAAQHFRIAKVSDGKATRTTAAELAADERIDEIARMLGGVDITTKTREHAAEMLGDAYAGHSDRSAKA